MFLMWALSRNSECGSVTAALAMLALPSGIVSVALKAGVPPRLVLPLRESFSFGLKASASQPATWKRTEGLAIAPSLEVSWVSIFIGSQEVGFWVNWGR